MATSAVVTGAAKGIGAALAQRLRARGHDVVLVDVDDAVHATAQRLGARSLVGDVREPEAHERAAAAAQEAGPLAVWVNNAGVLYVARGHEQPRDEVRRLVDVNLVGCVWGSQVAVEAMRAQGGTILNVASLTSFGPVPGHTVYAATKAAVLSFSLSLEGDLRAAGVPVRVRALCPDAVDTGMVHANERRPEADLMFTAPRRLSADEVADAGMELLDGRDVVRSIPRLRGAMAKVAAPFPQLGLRVLAQMARQGARRQREAHGPPPPAS